MYYPTATMAFVRRRSCF